MKQTDRKRRNGGWNLVKAQNSKIYPTPCYGIRILDLRSLYSLWTSRLTSWMGMVPGYYSGSLGSIPGRHHKIKVRSSAPSLTVYGNEYLGLHLSVTGGWRIMMTILPSLFPVYKPYAGDLPWLILQTYFLSRNSITSTELWLPLTFSSNNLISLIACQFPILKRISMFHQTSYFDLLLLMVPRIGCHLTGSKISSVFGSQMLTKIWLVWVMDWVYGRHQHYCPLSIMAIIRWLCLNCRPRRVTQAICLITAKIAISCDWA